MAWTRDPAQPSPSQLGRMKPRTGLRGGRGGAMMGMAGRKGLEGREDTKVVTKKKDKRVTRKNKRGEKVKSDGSRVCLWWCVCMWEGKGCLRKFSKKSE